MNQEKTNKGLDLIRELQEQSQDDYIFGGSSPRGIADDIHYKSYLPKGERQNIGEEKMDCASRSIVNILETKFNYLIHEGKISEQNVHWLKDNSYWKASQKDGMPKIELSDAFIAVRSGTTKQGNSLKAPCHAVYKYGLIPKSMLPQANTFEEHHSPARITKEMEDLGLEFNKRFTINYYKEYNYDAENEMLDTGGYAWGEIKDGVYQRTEYPFNHAFVYMTLWEQAFDNYIDVVDGDFVKQLAPDYKLLPYAYRIVIHENKTKPTFNIYNWFKKYICEKN